MKAATVTIQGKVQGVGFRYAARAKANDLNLAGWVANEADGSVRAFVQGPDRAVDIFTEWMRSGPAGATVSDHSISDQVIDDALVRFQVR